jgi:hypothetical protein
MSIPAVTPAGSGRLFGYFEFDVLFGPGDRGDLRGHYGLLLGV